MLPDADGDALLRKIAGSGRIAADPVELKRLLGLCAGLPLALRIVGSRLATRPHWKVADLVARLADARHRLDGLRHRDLEVRASFRLSYQALEPAARRLFRLLGLLDTPDFAVWTAAALLDTTPRTAQDLLDDLVDVRLLGVTTASTGSGVRYGFHDLIRIYARERAEAEEPADARRAALVRAFGAILALTGDAVASADSLAQAGVAHLEAGNAAAAVELPTEVVDTAKALGSRPDDEGLLLARPGVSRARPGLRRRAGLHHRVGAGRRLR